MSFLGYMNHHHSFLLSRMHFTCYFSTLIILCIGTRPDGRRASGRSAPREQEVVRRQGHEAGHGRRRRTERLSEASALQGLSRRYWCTGINEFSSYFLIKLISNVGYIKEFPTLVSNNQSISISLFTAGQMPTVNRPLPIQATAFGIAPSVSSHDPLSSSAFCPSWHGHMHRHGLQSKTSLNQEEHKES